MSCSCAGEGARECVEHRCRTCEGVGLVAGGHCPNCAGVLDGIVQGDVLRVLATLPRNTFPLPRATPPRPPPPAPKPPPEPGKEGRSRPLAVVVRDAHEVLRGIDADRLPPLTGLLPTAARRDADVSVPLATQDGRPVLALWRIGLGKAAVWTSDLRVHHRAWRRPVRPHRGPGWDAPGALDGTGSVLPARASGVHRAALP